MIMYSCKAHFKSKREKQGVVCIYGSFSLFNQCGDLGTGRRDIPHTYSGTRYVDSHICKLGNKFPYSISVSLVC